MKTTCAICQKPFLTKHKNNYRVCEYKNLENIFYYTVICFCTHKYFIYWRNILLLLC